MEEGACITHSCAQTVCHKFGNPRIRWLVHFHISQINGVLDASPNFEPHLTIGYWQKPWYSENSWDLLISPLNGNVTCTIISPSLMAKSPSISTSHGFDAELAVSRSSAACVMACVKCSQMWQQFKSTALGNLKACQMSGYHSFKKIQTCLQMACNMLCNHFAKRIKIGL